MELSDDAKAEIAAAIAILKEDGVHVHRTYQAFLKSQKTDQDDTGKDDKDTEGKPPPKKDPSTEPPVPPKSGLWWGKESDD